MRGEGVAAIKGGGGLSGDMTLTSDTQQARRRALEAARREQQEAAVRARDNLADLEKALAAQERLEAIDTDLDRQIAARTAELRARATDLFSWIAKGALKVRIGAEFPLAKAADSHRALEGRLTTGKVLLLP